MNDQNLTELLEARAADVPVGPAPLADMHRAASRRRRSYAVALAAAAAVVVTVGAVAVWPEGDGGGRDPQVATDAPSDSGDVPPAGYRWVGIGQAAVAVPTDWPVNALTCGTPTRDTVVVDRGVTELCLKPFPAGVTSVEVRTIDEDMDDVSGWTSGEVDGEEAMLSPDQAVAGTPPTIYESSVFLPLRDAMFVASSTVSQAAADEALTHIAVLESLIAVPGISPANYGVVDQSKAGETYVRTLEEAGFTVEVVTDRSQGISPGFVLGASPAPGTVVEPGSLVTVTVSG